jgi:hypothetical protein
MVIPQLDSQAFINWVIEMCAHVFQETEDSLAEAGVTRKVQKRTVAKKS